MTIWVLSEFYSLMNNDYYETRLADVKQLCIRKADVLAKVVQSWARVVEE